MTHTASVVVLASTRRAYAAERLRKAAEIEDDAERRKFLEEAIAKFHAWSSGLGVARHRIAADIAALRNELVHDERRLRA